MAYYIDFPTITDSRGSLSVIEKELPFEIRRVYYMYDVTAQRGGHRHKKTIQALICLSGSCEIFVEDGSAQDIFTLDSKEKCLIVEPKDWHTMDKFTPDTVLLVLASELYDKNDYITKRY